MQNNFDNVKTELENQFNSIVGNPVIWMSFLRTASNNYKYPFEHQVLIHSRKPEAVACASIDFWNKHNRWVKRGTKGIPLLDYSTYNLKYVFDVSDTNGQSRPIYLWNADKYHNEIIISLEDSFGERLDKTSDFDNSLIEITKNVVVDNIQDYFSFLTEDIKKIAIASVQFIVLSRCNCSAEQQIETDDFINISKCKSIDSICDLGTAISDISEMLLRQIERTVVSEKKIEQLAIAKSETLIHNQNNNQIGGPNNERTDISSNQNRRKNGRNVDTSERLLHSRMGSESRTGGTTDSDNNVYEMESSISEKLSEERSLENVNEWNIGNTPEGNRQTSNRNGRESDKTDDDGTRLDGELQSRTSDGMGGQDEQHQSLREGDSFKGSNILLKLPSQEVQIVTIEIKAKEKSFAFSISQEDIDAVLQRGSGFSEGKYRIFSYYKQNNSSKENASFLREEYGTGGSYPAVSNYPKKISQDHDSKGIRIRLGSIMEPDDETLLPWSNVAKRIGELIACDRYLSDKEKQSYPQYLAETEARKKRNIIAEKMKEVFDKYGDREDSNLNSYAVNSCISCVYTGEPETFSLTMEGDYAYPILKEAFQTISQNDDELSERANEVLMDLESDLLSPLRNFSIEKETKPDRTTANYSISIGNEVYIGIDKYEILFLDDNYVKLYDENFPIINKEYSREEFEKLVRENPLNDDFIISDRKENVGTLELTNEHSKNNMDKFFDFIENLSQEDIDSNLIIYVDDNILNNLEKESTLVNQTETTGINPIKASPRKRSATNDLFPEIPLSKRNQFVITDDNLGVAPPSQKIENNIQAIKILNMLEEYNRYATPEEQTQLSQYVGWGGLPDVFNETHSRYSELKQLLSDDEYSKARESSLTAFYTSPVIIRSMYQALEKLGFKTGNILEPSCAVGNFIGMLPENMKDSKVYGVELDSVSGRIAQQLYQKSSIAVQGFEKTSFPDSFFDVAIGNVPFGQYKVNDKKYDKNKFLIHDYFFAKALDKVRPGGVVAFITSKGTLDKKNGSVRKYIAQRADLIGAIRLPDNTFKANAGTEVTSDIIFLQKRDRLMDIEPNWVHLGKDENGIEMNEYFIDNPDMILGTMEMQSTAYGFDSTCKANSDESLEQLLHEALSNINGQISEVEFDDIDEDEDNSIIADPSVRNYSYTLYDGKVYFRENSRMFPVDMPVTTLSRIKGLIEIRDTLRTLIEYQTEDYSDNDIQFKQNELNTLYDNFVEKYGLITSRANSSAFAQDSAYPLVYSLEVIDDDGNFIRKADIFTKRTIQKHIPVTHVETSSEALAISLAEKARVDINFMSSLTDKTSETIVSELRGVIFKNVTGDSSQVISRDIFDINSFSYVTADEYLSGNVRNKLKFVKGISTMIPELADELIVNIKALEQVQPEDLLPAEISVRLGATWIPSDDIERFVFETLETPKYAQYKINVHYSQKTAEWQIEGKNQDRVNIKANNTFGTYRINAYKIIEETLNLKDVRIYDYHIDADGKRIQELNKKETTIAQQKQEAIKTAFQEWIWKDQQRRERLCRKYNDEFNNIRTREYNGNHLVFGGINPEINLREHQVNAIAHILYGGNTLLAHVVGAGKTFEMVAAAMESKRLGLCQKSLFVVPNHLTEQWASEFLQLYPGANILVTTKKNFETKNRKRFCARIATGDYDAVIMGHSQFEKVPMSIERQERILQDQLDEIMDGIEDLKRSNAENFTIKQLEKTKKNIELKIEKLNDQSRKDDVVTFEELGVDRLFVDEAHNFKNLFLYTKMRNVGGIAQTEAQKSSDLFMKCRYLDELTDGKGVIFATGTPISNSMVEMYTMQRYLQFDMLSEMRLTHFDSWASTFGETETAFELSPEGTGYRAKTRFSKFYNLPELMSMFKEVADIQTADMLKLPVPDVAYHNIALKPSELQKEIVSSLSERADKIRNREVEPQIDNMLKITNDGRKLALDQRLINDEFPDDNNSKTNICADNVFDIWEETKADKLTQMIFCDISTPHNDGSFNVYDDVRNNLIAKGIPDNEIEYIHNADSETKKKQLFGKVRSGEIRILLGSTAKMGAGTNVQQKLVALHHLDCPWRPSDLQQREGRIVRQGNENKKVDIFTYVTENTFDAYLYQLVENKQKFISQIMTSKAPVRSAEDIDDQALSYAEIKALATGDPRIKEKMDLDQQVSKLKLLKSSYLNEKYLLEDKIVKYIPEQIAKNKERIDNYTADTKHLSANTKPNKDGFSPMIINGNIYTEKKAAGNALLECKKECKMQEKKIGEYRGFNILMGIDVFQQNYIVTIKNKGEYTIEIDKDAFGNIQRIDNALERISKFKENATQQLEMLYNQLEKAKEEVKKPFAQEEQMKTKSERLAILNIELNLDNDKKDKNAEEDNDLAISSNPSLSR